MKLALTTAALIFASNMAFAAGHATPMVEGMDQDMSGGTVAASKIVAPANGWLVVHKTADGMAPGPVIGYSPLREGENMDVVAILTEPVASGEKVMLMLHGEDGGMAMGTFEYSLGAKEDGPVRVDGELVMAVVSAM